MSLDAWTIAALVCAAGAGGIFLLGNRADPSIFEWARALAIGAVALAISGAAAHGGGGLALWFSGFFVCAALHRVIDAVTQRRG
jgi:hypothetical protein